MKTRTRKRTPIRVRPVVAVRIVVRPTSPALVLQVRP